MEDRQQRVVNVEGSIATRVVDQVQSDRLGERLKFQEQACEGLKKGLDVCRWSMAPRWVRTKEVSTGSMPVKTGLSLEARRRDGCDLTKKKNVDGIEG